MAVARTQGALEDLDDEVASFAGHVSLVPADLSDGAVLDRIGAAIFARWGRLDILVGNAGELGVLSPVGHVDPATWDRVVALNLTANWRLIRSCDPLLRASESGRAIFVTAAVAKGRAYWGAYAASKAGLESLVRTYALEMRKTTVRVNLIDPGPTRTRLRATAYPGEPAASVKPPEDVTEAFVDLAAADCMRHGETLAL